MSVDSLKAVKTIIAEKLGAYGIELFGITDFSGAVENAPLLECANKKRLFEKISEPKSIIVCAFPYFNGKAPNRNLSYYAGVPDYHKVILPRLEEICVYLAEKTGGRFTSFCDNSPIREVKTAVRAGLGIIGDNGLLITERFGSFVFLAEIVTDLELEGCANEIAYCEHCGKCKAVCPTTTLKNGFERDKCLSHITQKRGTLSEQERELIKASGIVWGCDECQLCCPHNVDIEIRPFKEFKVSSESYLITSDEVDVRISDSAFSFRGDKPIRRNLGILGK